MWKDCTILIGLSLPPVLFICFCLYFIVPSYRVGDCLLLNDNNKLYRVTGFRLDRYILNEKIKLNYRMVDNSSKKVKCTISVKDKYMLDKDFK